MTQNTRVLAQPARSALPSPEQTPAAPAAPAPQATAPARPLRQLGSAAGSAALRALHGRRPLLAFEFDGTLAPVVARPEDARVPPAVASRLARLCALRPVAVFSGRPIADLRTRLDFTPRHLIGNHGAEDDTDPIASQRLRGRLDALRARLAIDASGLGAAGVSIEDKHQSISLHYRLARDRAGARAAIDTLLADLGTDLRQREGRCVVSLLPAEAPDAGHVMHRLLACNDADAALFVGTDVEDATVFDAAPAHWVTVRVGPGDAASRARFSLGSICEMVTLLDRLLAYARPQ